MSKTFHVLKPFTLRMKQSGAVLMEEGDYPILGTYHAGHDYRITPINERAVKEAAENGLVRL